MSDISNTLVTKIERIWQRASLPIVFNAKISQMIKVHHNKYRNLLKSKNRKGIKKYDINLETFLSNSKLLFDISPCKCLNFESCICSKEKKVAIVERSFLADQRLARKMFISNIDRVTTSALKEKDERKRKELGRVIKCKQRQTEIISPTSVISDSDSTENEINVIEEPGPSTYKKKALKCE